MLKNENYLYLATFGNKDRIVSAWKSEPSDILDPCRVTTLTNKIFRDEPVKMIVIGGSNSSEDGI